MTHLFITIIYLLVIVMVTMAILFVVSIFFEAAFFRFLRKHHEDIWHRLGDPSLILNSSIRNGSYAEDIYGVGDIYQ